MVQIGVKGQNVPQVWDSLSLGGGAVRSHSEGSKKATRVLGQRCHETDKLLENGGEMAPLLPEDGASETKSHKGSCVHRQTETQQSWVAHRSKPCTAFDPLFYHLELPQVVPVLKPLYCIGPGNWNNPNVP